MENGTVAKLLYAVLVLAILTLLSNFYVATLISRNSDELASLRLLLQKQMMGTAVSRADELQRKLDALNQSAGGIDEKMMKAQDQMDAKLHQAQDDFVSRMQVELPKIMDNYVKQRAGTVQKELQQRGVQVPK